MPASQSGSGKSAACAGAPAKKDADKKEEAKKAAREKRMGSFLFNYMS
jgi:ribosomal protein L12E/L44/L45/RPP1/RPP2